MITKVDFLKAISILIDKPGLYGINSVRDINSFITAEVFFNRNAIVEELSGEFSRFVIARTESHLQDFHWCKIISLYSGSDTHSIQLFKNLFYEFVENNYPKEYTCLLKDAGD